MPDLHTLTVGETASRIQEGTLTAVDLATSLLERSRQLEPELRLWVTLDDEAVLETASQRDRELAIEGPRGPLHGVPVGIKDIYYTQGVLTTACSPILANFVPDFDATAVAKLKSAGAIIMGKTVTTQFACGDPPPTRNPWNAEHTPGGSSSGSAVGVAAGTFPAALGSQTGGSMLRPAAFNGVVGLKPTFGRISRYGVVPVSASLDTMGHYARTVKDVALLLTVMSGHDASDPSSGNAPVPDYAAAAGVRQAPPRIGLVGKFFFERASDEMRAHAERVAHNFAEAGATVAYADLPTDFDELLRNHRVLMTTEAADFHSEWFAERPDDYSPNVRRTIETGIETGAVAYLKAKEFQRGFIQDVEKAFESFDVLMTPATPTTAPRDLSTTGDPMFQSPFTLGGFPAISLPSGLDSNGMPMGVQLAASRWDDARLLSVAAWCEQVMDVHLSPPLG